MTSSTRYPGLVILAAILLATRALAAMGQGEPKTIKLDAPSSRIGTGALRCAPDESIQFALIGLDENLNSTSLGQYAPQARSTSESIVVARVAGEAALSVNVLCVADGEAWITVEAAGVRADLPVLVGTARRNASPKGPHPELVGPVSARGSVAQASTNSAPTVGNANPAQLPITLKPVGEAPAALPITLRPGRTGQASDVKQNDQPAPPLPTVLTPGSGSVIPVTPEAPPAAEKLPATGTSQSASTDAGPGSGKPVINSSAQRSPTAGGVSSANKIQAGTGSGQTLSPLPAPTGVTATSLPGGQVSLTWNGVSGASLYHILYRKVGDSQWSGLTGRPGETVPTVTQYQTDPTKVVLPPGTLEFTVFGGRDAQDNSGERSSPVRMSVARYDGRYRVTVNGFRVHRESKDFNLEWDGKRDEVHVNVNYREYNPDGTPAGPIKIANSRTHGDTNAPAWQRAGTESFRYKAGSASSLGGLMTGDGFPDPASPWNSDASNRFSTETFPLFVWEGYLSKAGVRVELAPVIMEDDEHPEDPRTSRPSVPIGFHHPDPKKFSWNLDRKTINLTFEKAEEIISTRDPNSSLPLGIIEVRYKSPPLPDPYMESGALPYNADYSLYLEVRRLQ